MNEIFIPTMLFWENGNTWYGSKGEARFFISPITVEKEGEESDEKKLQIELWRGPLTKELSEILEVVSFPMTEEGLMQVVDWLEAKAAGMNEKK